MSEVGLSGVRLTIAGLLLSMMTVVGAATGSSATAVSQAAAVDPVIQIVGKRAPIWKGGKVPVKFRSRCASTLQAFEMNVSVTQGAVNGYIFRIGPPNVSVCDGNWHTTVVKVAPTTGKFHKGLANVEVSIQYYDTVQGNDTSAGAGKQLRLFR